MNFKFDLLKVIKKRKYKDSALAQLRQRSKTSIARPKAVKNITSKGFVRSNYEEKLVDLTDIRINLKSKN